MSAIEPADDYTTGVEELGVLAEAVRRQVRHDEVLAAVSALRLAVARAYAGRIAPRRTGSARSAILEQLRTHLGERVPGDESAAVSGVGEWARRVRGLRVEFRYEIEEQRRYYRLTAVVPCEGRRARWQTVTGVREAPAHQWTARGLGVGRRSLTMR